MKQGVGGHVQIFVGILLFNVNEDGKCQGRFDFFCVDIDAAKGLAQQLNII
ncbi:MAG: hypothetical protein HKN76_04475 [Saprospiraceae bacterium]|nr:hypothetical protein [Saprospiraceae bacterium]